ncbi:general stress protein [Paenibacillus eucommiae]|uniref:Membrane protein n=1 Tax=Paenibacillus eucommiae TaxID=1355755 RepID=A0ABS4J0E0_9BACL|nr:general stress protein [Paenibacillus eucommiae]MBP1993309.1 putative membrane protein [Paenibacillus eucommiae]
MNEKKIVGVFHTENEAINAIEGLKQQGYRSEDISVIAKDRDEVSAVTETTGSKAPEGLATGAAAGGVLGGVTGLLAGIGALAIPGVGPIIAAGPIAAVLTGAAVGAGTGGLVGGLIGLGIPEDEVEIYNNYVKEGNILVLVDSHAERDPHAYNTFRTNNSLNASSYESYEPYETDINTNRRL